MELITYFQLHNIQWRNKSFEPGGENFAEGGPLATVWECMKTYTHIHVARICED